MAEATLKVTQYRSAIGSKPKQRGTLRALGLGKIGRSHTLPDRPEIRGMLARVPHLVKVEAGEAAPAPTKAPAKKASPVKKASPAKTAGSAIAPAAESAPAAETEPVEPVETESEDDE